MSVTVSNFTELTTHQWHCMEVWYVCHCIDFHRTHNRSTTLHGSLICLSLYWFSLNSQQISYIAWKSATPTSVHTVIETCNKGHHSLDALHCTDVYFSTSLHADTLQVIVFNPLKPELNPICYLLALLGAHHFLHVSRIRVKLLTFRLLMS